VVRGEVSSTIIDAIADNVKRQNDKLAATQLNEAAN
jgi:hypothetical protein